MSDNSLFLRTMKKLQENRINSVKKENNSIDLEGEERDVITVIDPDLSMEEFKEKQQELNDMINDTPDGEIVRNTEYVGMKIYTCPLCLSNFYSETPMAEDQACPICFEIPEEFIYLGEIEQKETQEDLDAVENAEKEFEKSNSEDSKSSSSSDYSSSSDSELFDEEPAEEPTGNEESNEEEEPEEENGTLTASKKVNINGKVLGEDIEVLAIAPEEVEERPEESEIDEPIIIDLSDIYNKLDNAESIQEIGEIVLLIPDEDLQCTAQCELDNCKNQYNYDTPYVANKISEALKLENNNRINSKKEILLETGEWDENDEEMQNWISDMRYQAQELADHIHGQVKSVTGHDAYMGPVAIVHSPKHGDIELWYDQEDDTGRSFNAKIAHFGWIGGGILDLARILNQDEISDNERIFGEDKSLLEDEEKLELNEPEDLSDLTNKEIIEKIINNFETITHAPIESIFNYDKNIEEIFNTKGIDNTSGYIIDFLNEGGIVGNRQDDILNDLDVALADEWDKYIPDNLDESENWVDEVEDSEVKDELTEGVEDDMSSFAELIKEVTNSDPAWQGITIDNNGTGKIYVAQRDEDIKSKFTLDNIKEAVLSSRPELLLYDQDENAIYFISKNENNVEESKSLKEDISARPNEDKLINYYEGFLDTTSQEYNIILSLLSFMSDDDIKRFMEIEDYDLDDEEENYDLEESLQLNESKILKESSIENLYNMMQNAKQPFQLTGIVHAMSYLDDGLSNILNDQYSSMKRNNCGFEEIKNKLLDTINANMIADEQDLAKAANECKEINK